MLIVYMLSSMCLRLGLFFTLLLRNILHCVLSADSLSWDYCTNICIFHIIIISKSDISFINRCVVLGRKTMLRNFSLLCSYVHIIQVT